MSKHWYIYTIVVLIFSAAQILAKRYSKKDDGNVARLKPPILFVLMIPAAGLLFLFLLGVALKQGAGDDLWAMIALLSFFPLTMVFFYVLLLYAANLLGRSRNKLPNPI